MAQNSTIALLTIVVQRFYKSCWSWYWCINGASTAPPTPLCAVRIVSILHRKSDILLPATPLCATARNDGSSIEERHRNQKKEPPYFPSLLSLQTTSVPCSHRAAASTDVVTAVRPQWCSGNKFFDNLESLKWYKTFLWISSPFWDFSTLNDKKNGKYLYWFFMKSRYIL